MEPKKKESYTYGFEIEGAFELKMGRELASKHSTDNFHVDGSVNSHLNQRGNLADYSMPSGFEYYEDYEKQSEFSSPVYNSKAEMMDDLEMFVDGKTHFWDYSAGLHLNFGIKGITNFRKNKLYAALCNLSFQKKLFSQALKFCDCQKYRLQHPTTFYNPYTEADDIIDSMHDSSKYRFMRFHEDGNHVEFRFLSPCAHKVANVEKLLKVVEGYLEATTRERKTYKDTSPEQNKELIKIGYKEDKSDKVTKKRGVEKYVLHFSS